MDLRKNAKGIFIGIALVILAVIAVCVLEAGYGAFFVEPQIYQTALEVTEGISGNENKAIALKDWVNNRVTPDQTHLSFNFPFINIRTYQMAYLLGRGGCGEAARLFVSMARAADLNSRVISNDGENHAWAEVYLDGEWQHFDPSNGVYFNSHYYEEEQEPRRQYSYIYWEENGVKHNVTSTYTKTGWLSIKVYDGSEPVADALVEIRGSYRPDLVAISGRTNSDGIFEVEVGDNNYTIIAQKDSSFPWLVKKAEAEIELLPNKEEEVVLYLKEEFNLVGAITLFLLIVLLLLAIRPILKRLAPETRLTRHL